MVPAAAPRARRGRRCLDLTAPAAAWARRNGSPSSPSVVGGKRCHAVGAGALPSAGAHFYPLPEVAVMDFLEARPWRRRRPDRRVLRVRRRHAGDAILAYARIELPIQSVSAWHAAPLNDPGCSHSLRAATGTVFHTSNGLLEEQFRTAYGTFGPCCGQHRCTRAAPHKLHRLQEHRHPLRRRIAPSRRRNP